ncbi:MAG: glycosyl transferase family 1 [Phycisphaeraceae bacterium]|nr:glycosyl transferase family 1 [Phycisphaeraceae bacterium]
MPSRPRNRDSLKTVALIGTYLPRRCGIATFSADLSDAITAVAPETECWALALNDQPAGHRYPHRVKFEINERRLTDYRLAADFLNMSRVDVVSLQHEFGIFGGADGHHVTELLRRLRTPVVTTLHTVLKDPTPGQRKTLRRVAELSDRLIVMADRAVEFLDRIYDVPTDKIVHVPHGIPDVPFVDPNYYKDQYGVEGKKVILTFGLLSPGKGIETMIDALPRIVEAHEDVVYIVLGATHPNVQAEFGEDYRARLQRQAHLNEVGDHVIFHNRFVELPELCQFLGAADLYVTPYLSEAQIVSGTLAYALGTGNAVVSTPYWYAQEMLADGRGRIVPFKDGTALAQAIIDLFDHDVERHAMRKRAYNFTRDMVWPQVGRQYLDVFLDVDEARRHSPRPMGVGKRLDEQEGELTEVKLDHLHGLTDDTGILQHARGIIPNRDHGYCTDDNARALIAVLMAQDHLPSGTGCAALASRYLSFLDYAFVAESGRFRNFMGYDRRWLEQIGSEDSHGRAVWAVGETVARSELRGHLSVASDLLHRSLPALGDFTSPRAWAYGLIGIHAYLRRFGGDTAVRRVREQLSHRLMAQFRERVADDWPWLEDIVTYDNARLPQALLLAGQWMFDHEMIDMGLRALEWLYMIQRAPQGHFAPIGNQGWYPRGGELARFAQQPLEAAAMIDAFHEAGGATGDPKWNERADWCLNWFLGDNDVNVPVYDPITGGCCDGLHPEGTSENQGAESTLAWLLSSLSMHEMRLAAPAGEQSEPKTSTPSQSGADQSVVPSLESSEG